MTARIFVKVVGFTDVERHALNTVFRLSQERPPVYQLWLQDAPRPPQLELVDGDSEDSWFEKADIAPEDDDGAVRLIWVGPDAPSRAWRVFQRPLVWADLLHAMDDAVAEQLSRDW